MTDKTPVQKFLIDNSPNGSRINLTAIANLMYGTKTANESLSRKLKGIRPWTAKDEQKAIAALKELHIDIGKVIPDL